MGCPWTAPGIVEGNAIADLARVAAEVVGDAAVAAGGTTAAEGVMGAATADGSNRMGYVPGRG
jgi:hypothetical protein